MNTLFQLDCGHWSNSGPGAKCLLCAPTKRVSRPKRRTPATGHKMAQVSRDARPSPQTVAAQRERLLRALEEHGKLTMDALEVVTGLPVKTITWRMTELTTGVSPRVVKLDSKARTRSRAWAYEYAVAGRAAEVSGRLAL